MINEVYKFHRDIVKIPFPEKAGMLPDERMKFAYKAFVEEADEMILAQDFNEQADAILDLLYFAIGRLYEMGIPEEQALKFFMNVHKANMTKVRGKTKRGSEDDASKPEGWQPPFHEIGDINGK